MNNHIFKIFLITDDESPSTKVRNHLRKFSAYEIFIIPSVFNEFEIMRFEPDLIIFGNDLNRVINCYEWNTEQNKNLKQAHYL